MQVPAPAEQIRFLTNIQRLLAGGLFTATYKYALIAALADLSVELGSDSGEPLPLSTFAIRPTLFAGLSKHVDLRLVSRLEFVRFDMRKLKARVWEICLKRSDSLASAQAMRTSRRLWLETLLERIHARFPVGAGKRYEVWDPLEQI